MKQILLRGGLPLLAMVTLTGCFDDNYDLSDIDTTSEFKVKDLVLPINLDPVTLGDIIEIKEGEQIKEITLNGETFYAVQESGDFKSDEIDIPTFTAPAPTLSPSTLNFNVPSTRSIAKAADNTISLALTNPILKDITYSATNIDAAIMDISDIYTDNFSIKIDFKASTDVIQLAEVELTDIKLDIPKGIANIDIVPNGGEYNDNDGSLTIPSLPLDGNGEATILITASAINLPGIDATLDYDSHSLTINTKVNIIDAVLEVTPKSSAEGYAPSEVAIDINYEISALEVTAVSGTINYKLDGINISPVSLTDLPDFLAGDETNLILANPQIYLSVNNPVAGDKLSYSTGMNITATRPSGTQDFKLDSDITVGYGQGVAGPYQFCLSPKEPEAKPEEYSAAIHIAYTKLSEVISGNGIPESLEINLIDPQIYTQKVEKFELGRNLPRLEGQWDFLAPLALAVGTTEQAKIIYTKVVDGWGSDDLDKLVIQKLEVTLNVTNDTPLQAKLSGYPIDRNGKQINGVSIEGATIPGGAVNYPVTISITGEVKNLDGITFTATVTPENDNALSPNQSITLTDIRAKVSGNYTTDF